MRLGPPISDKRNGWTASTCAAYAASWALHGRTKSQNTEVLERTHSTSTFAMLSQHRLRRLSHVHRMDSSWLPRAILYGELSSGSRPTGRPYLRFKDVCRRDMRQAGIDLNSWEEAAQDRSAWRQTVATGVNRAEERRTSLLQEKRQRKKLRVAAPSPFVCNNCGRDCHARIGLLSYSHSCDRDDNPRAQSIVSIDGRMLTIVIAGNQNDTLLSVGKMCTI